VQDVGNGKAWKMHPLVLSQQPRRSERPGWAQGASLRHRRDRRASHSALAQRRGAAGTKELVQLPCGQHEQKPLAHRLRAPAFRAVKLTGSKCPKLFRHDTTIIPNPSGRNPKEIRSAPLRPWCVSLSWVGCPWGKPVAQICNPQGSRQLPAEPLCRRAAWQNTILRYSRLQICATVLAS
jgi:hypothetical protein